MLPDHIKSLRYKWFELQNLYFYIAWHIHLHLQVLKQASIHLPDSIALADREGKEGRRAASFTILASYLHRFDFMKLETRLTTQPAR